MHLGASPGLQATHSTSRHNPTPGPVEALRGPSEAELALSPTSLYRPKGAGPLLGQLDSAPTPTHCPGPEPEALRPHV